LRVFFYIFLVFFCLLLDLGKGVRIEEKKDLGRRNVDEEQKSGR